MTNIQVFQNFDGEAITSSYNIAVTFSKNHKDVLSAIRRILNNIPDEIGRRNFTPTLLGSS